MTLSELPYPQIWLCDFEFRALDGERPTPLCMVAREMRSGRVLRIWRDELVGMSVPPFPIDSDSLFVAYYASAELGCFLALGWPMPARILDLCAEFKCLVSGLTVPCGRGLLGAMTYFGLNGIAASEKERMQQLAMRGGEYSPDERRDLLDYCETDVDALAQLLPAMLPMIDLPRALLRGRYMAATARIEWTGVPIDTEMLSDLRRHWETIKSELVAKVDANFGFYEGLVFKQDRFARYLAAHGIPWPHLPSGALDLSDDTFREMARSYPELSPLRELRHALSALRLNDLAVGSDGRNRCLLGAFGSKTGRNQPSNTKGIFGPAVWLRCLIKPEPGRAIAYIDYEQQEFGIAAAMSGDVAMMEAYRSGDPYLAFAKQAGAVPADATKRTHKAERDRFKVVALAVQYGMAEQSLAVRLNESPARARELLRLHRDTYPDYWSWSDAVEVQAMLSGSLRSAFGWWVHVGPEANPRGLRNFPLQANGAEMLRIAACEMTESGINVCALIHDAVLIEASEDEIDARVADCQRIMARASATVLGGFELRTEAMVVRHPDRYMDERGEVMFRTVQDLLARQTGRGTGATLPLAPVLPPYNLISSIYKSTPHADPSDRLNRTSTSGGYECAGDSQPQTASTPEGREVSPGADPVAVVDLCITTEGAGSEGRVDSLASGWTEETRPYQVLSPVGNGVGDEQRHSQACAAESGDSGTDFLFDATGSGLGGDPPPLPVSPPVGALAIMNSLATDDERDRWLEEFNERAGIMESDGNVSREDAERLALTAMHQLNGTRIVSVDPAC